MCILFCCLFFVIYDLFIVPKSPPAASPKPAPKMENGMVDDEVMAANRLKFAQKMSKKKSDTK